MFRIRSSYQAIDFSYDDRLVNCHRTQVENNKNSVHATNQITASVEASREGHLYELHLRQWTFAMSNAILI
jgi:hypothetical protein